MSDIGPTTTATPARELSSYNRVPRGNGAVQPTLIGVKSPYPAIRYALADILGYVILTGPVTLLAGNWYYLNLSGGSFTLTLPPLSSLNLGDAIAFGIDQNARINPATIQCQGTDLIQGELSTFTGLLCDQPHDRFWMTKAETTWNVV